MTSRTNSNTAPSKSRRIEFLRTALLAAVIAIIWCVVNNRTSAWRWNVPLGYNGDFLIVMGWAKSAADGHYWPLLPKFNPSLGAPFTANWNDYPLTEDTLVFFMGCLAKIAGLFPGCNLAVLIGAVLAGTAFHLTCRELRYSWEWALAGAVIFTFSPFVFFRGLRHITLDYYWHVPLCILACWWMTSRRGLDFKEKRFWFALAVGFVTGIQNPYYTNMFLQFTGIAFLAQLIRRSPWRKLVAPVAVGAAALCGFLLMNLDTLSYQATHGKNPAAVKRNYIGLEAYALKPLELLVPPPDNSIPSLRKLGVTYGKDTFFPNDEGYKSAYLGVAGIAALLWLLCISISKILSQPARPMPARMLQIIWIIAYSMVGGWNCFLGLFGFQLFRGTNRFSIWILALLLLFLVERLSKISRTWPAIVRVGLAILLCAVALVDQVPPIPRDAALKAAAAVIDSDKGIVDKLTAALPAQSMVFQLPVADYPESPPIVGMTDYEHMRPYLFSHQLRFSYGNDKGRSPDVWQHETGGMAPADMVARLEATGFGAIWIDRKGYADNGKALIDGLRDAGRAETIESAQGDFLCVLLHPSAHPVTPAR